METIWLTKLILAHLLTDFLLQPDRWISERRSKHFRSVALYLHTIITAFAAWLFIGWEYWLVAIIILITHTLIDIWKSYRPDTTIFFLVDQLLHLLVILGCWWFTFYDWSRLQTNWQEFTEDGSLLIKITAFVFVSYPCGILVGQLTNRWSRAVDKTGALDKAGQWIGIIERVIILVLVLEQQFEAIGLIIAAKGIIRFNESNRTEQKTEYLLIGTMISFSLAIIAGLIVLRLS